MKVYAAIGHFKKSENITSVAMKENNRKSFEQNLRGNEFVPYVVITEKMHEKLSQCDGLELFEQVKKMTTNYRVWNDCVDYLEECFDILTNKMEQEK